MGQADRLKMADIQICKVGSSDVISKLITQSSTSDGATVDVTCAKDTRRYYKAGIVGGTIECELVVETSAAFTQSVGTLVTYTQNLGGVSEVGSGILSRHGRDGGGVDGRQGETFTITICGTPSLS